MKFTVGLINLLQGFIYAGDSYPELKFSGFQPGKYIDFLKGRGVDILCLQEVLYDDQVCNGSMLPSIQTALSLKYADKCCNEHAWLYEGKYYGTAILSRFPIRESSSVLLPNPKLEIDQPDGTHWVMHDKYTQRIRVEIGHKLLDIFTFQYFPLHRFKRQIDDPEFSGIRQGLARTLTSDVDSIVAADLNHFGVKFTKAFPEITSGGFGDAIETTTTSVGTQQQTDHILYRGKDLKVIEGVALKHYSDHYYIEATFELEE